MKNNYLGDILLYVVLVLCLLFLNSCKPTLDVVSSGKAYGKVDLSNAGVETAAGVIISSSIINVPIVITINISDIKGVAISSPSITIPIKVLDNYKQPVVGSLTVFSNQSKSNWLTYIILILLLGNFLVLVIHLRRIK